MGSRGMFGLQQWPFRLGQIHNYSAMYRETSGKKSIRSTVFELSPEYSEFPDEEGMVIQSF
jgi:hypothetical protein